MKNVHNIHKKVISREITPLAALNPSPHVGATQWSPGAVCSCHMRHFLLYQSKKIIGGYNAARGLISRDIKRQQFDI